jgi:PAS domain S-box-containing protein
MLVAGLVVAGTLTFYEDRLPVSIIPALVYVPLPFLLWAAVRFGPAGTSGTLLIMTLMVQRGAIHGLGPFSEMELEQNVFSMQIFMVILSIALLFLTASISERHNAGSALNESERRFQTAADGAPVMLWMSGLDKLCTFFNRGWLEFTGRSMAAELGNGWVEGVHPKDLEGCIRAYTEAFDMRNPFKIEYRLRRNDGEYRWILDHGVPRYSGDRTFQGYIGTAVDITERKEAEEALARSEKRYREVVESQRELVCRYLLDTTLTFVNEAFCRFFGKSRRELIGHPLLELIQPEEHADVLDRIRGMIRHRHTVTVECKMISAGGAEQWQQWVIYPAFNEAGRVVEFQSIARDITERRKAEDSLRATQVQINALASQLIRAQEEERKRIARDLHDDFNQRLAAHAIALSNFRELISSEERPVRERLEKLHDEAITLGDDIRLIAHELHPPQLEEAGLESTIRAFCNEFSTLTGLRVELAINVNGPMPGDVMLCCYRVVQEAMRNISKHAGATAIQINLHSLVNHLVLLIADNGAGLNADRAKSLNGLGISSMEERVRFLSGHFQIRKREKAGTLVAVELPIL